MEICESDYFKLEVGCLFPIFFYFASQFIRLSNNKLFLKFIKQLIIMNVSES